MNYEDVIEAALKQGDSFEQIAAAFSEALNKREKDSRQYKFVRGRQDLCQTCVDDLSEALSLDEFYLSDIANAAILWVADEEADWDAGRLRAFGDTVSEYASELYSKWVRLSEENSTSENCCSDNKRKEEERAAPAGNPRYSTAVDPAEIAAAIKEKYPNLYKWLNDLNLV